MAVGSLVAPVAACRPVRVAARAVLLGIGLVPAVVGRVAGRMFSPRVGAFGVVVGIAGGCWEGGGAIEIAAPAVGALVVRGP